MPKKIWRKIWVISDSVVPLFWLWGLKWARIRHLLLTICHTFYSVGLAAQGSNVSYGSGLSPNYFSLFIHEIKKCILHWLATTHSSMYDTSRKWQPCLTFGKLPHFQEVEKEQYWGWHKLLINLGICWKQGRDFTLNNMVDVQPSQCSHPESPLNSDKGADTSNLLSIQPPSFILPLGPAATSNLLAAALCNTCPF